jgi:hypothetical protein
VSLGIENPRRGTASGDSFRLTIACLLILQYFVMELFLYRVSRSRHADEFFLKGALMFTAWQAAEFRPTRDIAFLGKTGNDRDEIAKVFPGICDIETDPDGLRFDAALLEVH